MNRCLPRNNRSRTFKIRHIVLIAAILPSLILTLRTHHVVAEDLLDLEERSVREAVERIGPSIVQIQTVGGLEKVDGVLIGTGPTTGLIIGEGGWVVSSAFNFAQKPSSILVRLSDGSRHPAELVATDHSRMVVLLKIESDEALPVPQIVSEEEMKVGGWAIAVGRTFAEDSTHISVGIISALKRSFGTAIQTDAKISPNNYGGPLVDIRGRALGLLVPISPQSRNEVAGVEWYDSGIGFAIPLQHIQHVLPRLKSGEDLHPGILGISLKPGGPYSTAAEIATCKPKSPAREAGLQPGDRIVAVDGVPVETQMQLRLQLGFRYAGDPLQLAILRDDDRLDRTVELVDKLPPFEHGFLGVLPLRNPSAEAPQGVAIRYVFPSSPADKAGIQVGDELTSLGEAKVTNLADALQTIQSISSGEQLSLKIRRNDEILNFEVVAGSIPTEIPTDLPPSAESIQPGNRPEEGVEQLKLPEFKNECTVYVPENYDPNVPQGVLLWIHAPGGFKDNDLVRRWKPHCDRDGLILVAPHSIDPARWNRTEAEYLRKLLSAVDKKYTIDANRIVVHGHQAGGAMAYLLAIRHRDLIRGVAVVDAPVPRSVRVPANDPEYRLTIYSASADKARFAKRIASGTQALQEAKYPVTILNLGDEPRYLNDDELAALVRWIDTLDRI